MPSLEDCPACGHRVSSAAASCPSCGHPLKSPEEPVWQPPTSRPVYIAAPNQERWKTGTAAVLALVIPGAGHLYKGQTGQGVGWFFFVMIFYAMSFFLGACGIVALIFHVVNIFSATSGDPTKYGKEAGGW